MASIPLAANNLKIPEPGPNAIDMLRQIAQLKAAGQENQQRDIAIQQQQRQLQDDTTIREAYGRNNGDVDKTLHDIAGKVSPQAFQAAQQHAFDLKQKAANLVAQQGDIALKQSDAMQGAHDIVDKAPDEQKPIVYQQQMQALHQAGIDVSQMPPQYPGNDQFKTIGLGIKTHSKLMEEAAKQAESQKNVAQAGEATARAGEAQANTAKLQAELNFYKTQGLAPGVPLDAQEAASWLKQNPGKTPADFMKYKSTLVPQMNFNLQNQGATGTGGQPSAIAKGIADGSIKWGDAVSARTPMAVKTALLQEVKSINPSFKSSDFDVEKRVQEKYTSGNAADQLTAINTAREHMATFKQTADALNNGNVLMANKVGNWLGTQFGSDKATNFNVARSAFAGEVGKAFAGANVGVQDRQELIDKINQSSSWDQLKGYADTADKLLEGKQKSLKEGFTQGMQGKPNFGNQQTIKTLSMSQIQQAAKDHGVSVDEAKRQAIAAGYQVQ